MNTELQNPFPGLRPFRSDEDYLFFGREEQTEELLGRLRRNRFMAVVGSSGSGKSSLVRCGVLSELQGGSLIEAGSDWEIAVLQPGGDPIGNLAAALCGAELYDPEDPEALPNLVATLTRSRWGLVEAARQSEMEAGSNLLVVVDQFEEIFRFHEAGRKGEEQAPDFVQLLLEAAAQEEVPIYVMITMRSDFLGDCAQFAGLAEAVNEGEYLIPRMNRDQSEAAIEGPVKVAGGVISRRLVQRLLNDLGEDPDQLPIMQHALMRTWDCWRDGHQDGEPADLGHYEAVGRTAEALSRHADEIFAGLPSDRHRGIARRIFKALTEKEDDGRGVRRPARLRRLGAIVAGDEEEVRAVVDAFRQPGVTFLMPGIESDLEPTSMVDISHESLMRIWQRLDRWVEDESQSARIYRRLRETAELHREGKAGLYHNPDLQIAQSWREVSEPGEAWAAQYGGEFSATMEFLEQSEAAARQAEREAEEARQREMEQATALAETQQRAARGFRRFAMGMAVVALAALVAFVFALNQKAKAVAEGENAEQERQNAQGSAELAREAEVSARRRQYVSDMSLVQQALVTSNYQRAKALLEQHVPEAGEADLRGWEWRYLKAQSIGNESARLGPFEEAIFSVDHSPDGRWLGIALIEGGFALWDTELKKVVHRRQLTNLSHFAFSPSENLIALSESGSSSLSLLRIESDGAVGETQIEVGERSGRFAFSPDGRMLAFIVNAEEVLVRDLVRGEQVLPAIPSQGGFNFHAGRLALSDRVLAIGTGRSLRVHSLADGALQFEAEHPENITALAISPDGRYLASGTGVNEDAIRIWDLDTGSETPAQVIEDHLAWICWLQFAPDGRLVSSSGDQTVRVWEMNEGRFGQSQVLLGNEDEIYSLSVSSDGTELVSGCKDGWIRFYNLENTRSHAQHKVYPLQDESRFPGMSFSADGEALVTLGPEGQMVLIDAKSLEVTRELPGLGTELRGVLYIDDGDGELLLVVDEGRQLTAYDVDSDQVVEQRASPFAGFYGSANGQAVALGGSEVSYLDPRTLEEIRALPTPEGFFSEGGGQSSAMV